MIVVEVYCRHTVNVLSRCSIQSLLYQLCTQALRLCVMLHVCYVIRVSLYDDLVIHSVLCSVYVLKLLRRLSGMLGVVWLLYKLCLQHAS